MENHFKNIMIIIAKLTFRTISMIKIKRPLKVAEYQQLLKQKTKINILKLNKSKKQNH